jgi:hypothetical protein
MTRRTSVSRPTNMTSKRVALLKGRTVWVMSVPICPQAVLPFRWKQKASKAVALGGLLCWTGQRFEPMPSAGFAWLVLAAYLRSSIRPSRTSSRSAASSSIGARAGFGVDAVDQLLLHLRRQLRRTEHLPSDGHRPGELFEKKLDAPWPPSRHKGQLSLRCTGREAWSLQRGPGCGNGALQGRFRVQRNGSDQRSLANQERVTRVKRAKSRGCQGNLPVFRQGRRSGDDAVIS